MSDRRFLIATVATALIASFALAQQGSPQLDPKYTQSPTNPYFVDCGTAPNHTSESARSLVLVSPAGNRAAYAEAKARLISGTCVNTSYLYVRSKVGAYQLAFLQEPTEESLGNGIRLIDWSRDGKRLLFDVLHWQFASDANTTNEIWIYYPQTGVFKTAPVQSFITNAGEGCLTTVEPLGFTESGKVAIRVSSKQDYDVDGEMRKPACELKQVPWLFDPVSNGLTQSSDVYSVPKWGKTK